MKKSLFIAVFFLFSTPAYALTQWQIDSIVGLLRAFNVEESIVNTVKISLKVDGEVVKSVPTPIVVTNEVKLSGTEVQITPVREACIENPILTLEVNPGVLELNKISEEVNFTSIYKTGCDLNTETEYQFQSDRYLPSVGHNEHYQRGTLLKWSAGSAPAPFWSLQGQFPGEEIYDTAKMYHTLRLNDLKKGVRVYSLTVGNITTSTTIQIK